MIFEDHFENLERIASEIENSIGDCVYMYAVISNADSENPFLLRGINIDRSSATESFDLDLVKTGLGHYLDNREKAANIDQAIDDKNAIAAIPLDYFLSADEPNSKTRIELLIEEVERLSDNSTAIPTLKTCEFESVTGIVFRYAIGQEVVYAYQRVQSMWMTKRSKILWIEKEGFSLFTGESLRIGNYFDFIIYHNIMLVKSTSVLESHFGFLKTLKSHALAVCDALNPLISDRNGRLADRVAKDKASVIRKLVKIQHSPVLRMSPSEIRSRVKGIPEYNEVISFDKDDHIVIEYFKDIEPLLRMMNDQIVESPLTDARYESIHKSELG